MEPLKKIQVDGFAMFAEPELLFGNLDELCCVSKQSLSYDYNNNFQVEVALINSSKSPPKSQDLDENQFSYSYQT